MEFVTAYAIVCGLLVVVVTFYSVWLFVQHRGNWRTVVEGKLGRVEYGLNRDVVVIYFFHDDSIAIPDGRLSVPYSSGTEIKVQRNNRGRYRVKKA